MTEKIFRKETYDNENTTQDVKMTPIYYNITRQIKGEVLSVKVFASSQDTNHWANTTT